MSNRELKQNYRTLHHQIAAVLIRFDPVGAFSGGNTDEYVAEAALILARLSACKSAAEACSAIYNVFLDQFGPCSARSPDHYNKAADEIWELWLSSTLS
jgi:hypothetical protein